MSALDPNPSAAPSRSRTPDFAPACPIERPERLSLGVAPERTTAPAAAGFHVRALTVNSVPRQPAALPAYRSATVEAVADWAPTIAEMELMFRACLDQREDPDATNEIHGPATREYAICIACAHGSHDQPGPHADCDCACHAKPARKQTDLREFYTNPVAFGLKLAGVR